MKNLLLTLLSSSFIIRAAQDETATPESYSSEFMQEASSLPQKAERGWRDMVMDRWYSLSPMSQKILLILLALAVCYMVFRIVKCGGGCSCGCKKSGSCSCKK
ncbi:MAG TPA: hypothetical protein VLG50_03590 [Candidatus Saccharimonadales bacterium]|nr:hypothetical protein [Candidatus Saccharimonadales bacterium]